ncbi:PREDICTED: chymotrypsin-1-like [Ceratosolen solmsi marchali]|uniref:Chymotrypsin-1-like n=1 Tax=Ceratosolen solmsi marchali TaxID=326594 RepID=A0AAJ7DYQ4_9HYME|nr:PREDICTED: chymotrypsin-1-like [Ceratosolen solmsi marchali]
MTVGVLCKKSRILGGKDADIKEMPYQVAIKYVHQNILKCGGSIVTDKHILTAAHCVATQLYSEMIIIAGTTNLNDILRWTYMIDHADIHPSYTGEMSNNTVSAYDIAVITIQGTIVFNEYQNKIDLPTIPYHIGDEAIISGWGWTTYPATNTPALLQTATVIIVSNEECADNFEFPICDYHMCTLQLNGIGVCTVSFFICLKPLTIMNIFSGDSGGPVVSNGKLIGVISFGVPCATGVPDVHTSIDFNINFIRSVINQ